MSKKIAITLGDPSSIGAEITHKALASLNFDMNRFVLIGNQKSYGKIEDGVDFIDIKSDEIFIPGKPSAKSGEVAFRSVEKAIELAKSGMVDAIVTAPISKAAINLAGYSFSGHTEIFDKYLSGDAQMLFVAGDFRVLLLTRHVPIKDVPSRLKRDFIFIEVQRLHQSLQKLGMESPRIALCGLNPHAGEDGLLGREELEEFLPAIKELKAKGMQIEGPFAADMLFSKAANSFKKSQKQPYDCYVATYHDQGLCAVKSIDLANTVNVTIGLEVLRTSPAHGTAFDIAGQNIASSGSMQQAIVFAYNHLK